jgi:hypothetical protein
MKRETFLNIKYYFSPFLRKDLLQRIVLAQQSGTEQWFISKNTSPKKLCTSLTNQDFFTILYSFDVSLSFCVWSHVFFYEDVSILCGITFRIVRYLQLQRAIVFFLAYKLLKLHLVTYWTKLLCCSYYSRSSWMQLQKV